MEGIIEDSVGILMKNGLSFRKKKEIIEFKMPFRADIFHKFNKCSNKAEAELIIEKLANTHTIEARYYFFLDLITDDNGIIVYIYKTHPAKNKVTFTLKK